MEGFQVFQFAGRYPEALEQLAEWRSKGLLKQSEDNLHPSLSEERNDKGGPQKTLQNKGFRTLHPVNLGGEMAPPKFGGYGLTGT